MQTLFLSPKLGTKMISAESVDSPLHLAWNFKNKSGLKHLLLTISGWTLFTIPARPVKEVVRVILLTARSKCKMVLSLVSQQHLAHLHYLFELFRPRVAIH